MDSVKHFKLCYSKISGVSATCKTPYAINRDWITFQLLNNFICFSKLIKSFFVFWGTAHPGGTAERNTMIDLSAQIDFVNYEQN